ncbi:MAG: Arabinose efflux permease [Methanomicrobiales archaeon 53_19]|nr:MAG: Arabinose efflux permease [Methanocalculus sp. 52_23]KUL04285.1 MAG: Arabinose efflux permease [Methanomicrobiales archaeon 53_19]
MRSLIQVWIETIDTIRERGVSFDEEAWSPVSLHRRPCLDAGIGVVLPLPLYYADTLGATGIGIGPIFSGFALSRAVFMPLIG